ncbi:P-loop containing nucleoside triphosphate hydrolase protein [Blastocladiella britannica]|nr:P-loop containing nucleoside triphosphate hydrolase protein [Blastocladiella britannica]
MESKRKQRATQSTPVDPAVAATLAKRKGQLLPQRMALPVWQYQERILAAARKYPVLVIVGETGSGKTTQIPQFLLDGLVGSPAPTTTAAANGANGGTHKAVARRIAVTQPRRISAISLAQRVAQERGTAVGAGVGYTVRFDDTTSRETQLRYVTDGMLLRELLVDPLLSRYDAVILDEAHERSVRTDVLLGMVKRILEKRTDLRVIVMSATLEAGLFTGFFTGAHTLHIPGRLYPIRVHHTIAPVSDYVHATLQTIWQLHTTSPISPTPTDPGNILAFFNGQDDIEAAASLLRTHAAAVPGLYVCPLFANLPLSAQRSVFDAIPTGYTRKVVLSTNIAETSVTLPGVRYVVDHGLAKIKQFHPRIGLEALVVSPISQAAAVQRAGRAGREAPGAVYRLYPESAFRGLAPATAAEIHRANLAAVTLQLMAAGVPDVQAFDFIERPDGEALAAAVAQLAMLGAVSRVDRALTPVGLAMSRFPVDPALARVLVDATGDLNNATVTGGSGVSMDLLSVLALLSQDTVFYTPSAGDARDDALEARRKFVSSDGDLITWLQVVRAFDEVKGDDKWCQAHFVNGRNVRQVLNVRKQLAELLGAKTPISTLPTPPEILLQQYLRGFFRQVAILQPNGRYVTVHGRHEVGMHPSSVLFARRVPIVSFVEMGAGESGRWFIRGCSRVDPSWVAEATKAVMGGGSGMVAVESAQS